MRRTISISSLVLFLTILPSPSALAKRAASEETTPASAKRPGAAASRTAATEPKSATVAPEQKSAAKPSGVKSAPKPSEPTATGSKRAETAPGAETSIEPSARASEQPKLAAKSGQKKAKKNAAPCFAPEVHLVRKRGDELETRDLHLTFCDGSPNPSALDSLSVLARPRNVDRPFMPEIKAYQRLPVDRGKGAKRRPEYLSERVMRVHPGLLVRLQRVAQHYPGRTIEIISGHRPDARDTSRHHHGRALDVRVDGVKKEALRDYLRSFDETGVGYYPNGYFVHLDVRDDRGYWVDRSGPGEAADYGPWPPPGEEIERVRSRVIETAVAELTGLGTPNLPDDGKDALAAEAERNDVPTVAVEQVPAERAPRAHEGDELSRAEIARIKAEARQALTALEISEDP